MIRTTTITEEPRFVIEQSPTNGGYYIINEYPTEEIMRKNLDKLLSNITPGTVIKAYERRDIMTVEYESEE